jgi:hypothetical protein
VQPDMRFLTDENLPGAAIAALAIRSVGLALLHCFQTRTRAFAKDYVNRTTQ